MTQAATASEPLADPDPLRLDKLLGLAQSLRVGGRPDDALTLFEHLLVLRPGHPDVLLGVVMALGTKGDTLGALEQLVALRAAHPEPSALISVIREQSLPAVGKFNACIAAGDMVQAERYAAALAALVPQSPPMQAAALSCNLSLGRADEARRYATALIALDPENAAAQAVLDSPAPVPAEPQDDLERRIALALAGGGGDTHPLLRLRDLHDLISEILCHPLDARAEARIEDMLAATRALVIEVEPGSEWEGWAKHYRVLLEAIDLEAVRRPTPGPAPDPALAFATSAGSHLDWAGVARSAKRLGAQAVFFAAADETYVDLYARWYVRSILKHCDVPCLIVVHVIGGLGRLGEIARKVGVDDPRLVFCGDAFDAEAVATLCFDAPPKGLIARPVAHFQSVRFQRLGALLAHLARPVFVSDIDLLLQRGVQDLLERCAGDDVVLNENLVTTNAGARLTANLVLVNPTANAQVFLRFLGSYLDDKLSRAEVTRWIDQVALTFARHHLRGHGQAPQIGYFDTNADINNVMYPSFQQNPFRFLSLFHGFDTSSLEQDDEPPVAPRPRKAAKPKARAKAKTGRS